MNKPHKTQLKRRDVWINQVFSDKTTRILAHPRPRLLALFIQTPAKLRQLLES